jgi:hypothetical protein
MVNPKAILSLMAVVVLLAAGATASQKKEQKPDVHADFQFGSYPLSRTAMELMGNEQARLILAGYHEGWSFDKLSKTFRISIDDLTKISDQLEDEQLGGRRNEYDIKPFMVVVREAEFDRLKESLDRHTAEFTKVLEDNLKDIEAMAVSLSGSKNTPAGQVMYETVVSGVLLGGLVDALYEDKTLMLPPPRRGRNERYYAWMVESNPAAAGLLLRELRESDGYRIVTIGKSLASERLHVADLRGKASVYDEADARRYRTFISVLSRDKLLPFFKSRRAEFLKLGPILKSGRYVAFAEFFAWYYHAIVNSTVDNLVRAGRISAPETLYTYAIRAPQ